MVMLDHVTIHVDDVQRSRDLYRAALAPIGYALLHEFDSEFGPVVAFGAAPKAAFWIAGGGGPKQRVHFAFTAPSRAAVDAFYAAALAAGGTDNGAPGPRPHYHKDYYGAFVLDFDGYNIEAVCHTPG